LIPGLYQEFHGMAEIAGHSFLVENPGFRIVRVEEKPDGIVTMLAGESQLGILSPDPVEGDLEQRTGGGGCVLRGPPCPVDFRVALRADRRGLEAFFSPHFAGECGQQEPHPECQQPDGRARRHGERPRIYFTGGARIHKRTWPGGAFSFIRYQSIQ
jgi:hypothetical protein